MLLAPAWAVAAPVLFRAAAAAVDEPVAGCAPRPPCWSPGMMAPPAWPPMGGAAAGTVVCGVRAAPGLACGAWTGAGCAPALLPEVLPGAAGPVRWAWAVARFGGLAGCAGRRRPGRWRAGLPPACGATAWGTPGIAASADMLAAPTGVPGPVEACPAAQPPRAAASARAESGAGAGRRACWWACTGSAVAPGSRPGAGVNVGVRSAGRAGCASGAGRADRPG